MNHYEKCQIYAPFIHSPIDLLHSLISPWTFYQWGSDILIHFLLVVGQLKFLIIAVDYFTKWVEYEVVPWIMAKRVRRFYRRNITCHFGLLGTIVSCNGMQFASSSVVEICRHFDILNQFIFVKYPG